MLTPELRGFQVPTSPAPGASRLLSKTGQICQKTRKGAPSGTPSCCFELGGRDSNPEWQGQNLQCCRLHHPRTGASKDSARRAQGLPFRDREPLLEADEAAETDHPGDTDLSRLGDHVAELREALDGAGPGR
jgi:hypothetical protein